MFSSVKKILIPTDFSYASKKALSHAAVLAEKTGAKITLLNVIDPPFNFPTNVEGVIDYLQENAESHLEEMIELVQKKYPGKKFTIKSQIRIGKPVSQILEAISDLNIDLVVIGSGADSPAKKVLFGSVSTDVILRSNKPVLAVPEKSDETRVDYSQILFTTNFRQTDYKNLNLLVDFAKLFDSTIDILHISNEKDLDSDIKFRGFKQLATDEQIYDKLSYNYKIHQDAFEGISEYISENSISLMVMNRYKKSIVGLLVDKNYAKKLSIYSEIPLLVLIGE